MFNLYPETFSWNLGHTSESAYEITNPGDIDFGKARNKEVLTKAKYQLNCLKLVSFFLASHNLCEL